MHNNFFWIPNYFSAPPAFPDPPTQEYPPVWTPSPKDYETLLEKYSELEAQHEALKEQYQQLLAEGEHRRKRVKRRPEAELNKCFHCPYPHCSKDYASELALNLHIRSKHNGGSKKQRDRAARAILRAQNEGRPVPKSPIQLPPGYLEANKIRLLLQDSESEDSPQVKLE